MYQGIADKCPRSKVLANSKILGRKIDGGEKYKWMGVLPLEVSGSKEAKEQNTKIIIAIQQLQRNADVSYIIVINY